MAYELPPLVWLRAFEAAARHAGFTAAAAELRLTPAAVSYQVRSLEKHLGFSLFERLPRSVRLTDMGQAYLPSVRNAFDELAASTFGLFGPMGDRSVTVRAHTSYAVLALAPRLNDFLEAYPEIEVRLCSATWADAATPEGFDLDIRFGEGRWAGFRSELIENESAMPVCSNRSCELLGGINAVADFAQRDLIHIMGYQNFWMQLFSLAGLEGAAANRGVKVDTSLAALELASAGTGCAVVLRSFAKPFIDAGRLRAPLDVELPLERSHYLLIPEDGMRLRPEVQLFREWLLDAAGSR